MSHGTYPPVERIDLGDGNWWEIYTDVTRGMRKRFRRAAMAALLGKVKDGTDMDLSDADALRRFALQHPGELDLDAMDDAYLIHGTHAWSYPMELSLPSLDMLQAAAVEQVLVRMRKLYEELPTETRKN